MRLEKPICASRRLLEVSSTLPLTQFQWTSDWRWPFLVLSRKLVLLFLFPRLCFRRSIGFVPAGSVSSSSTLHIFRDASHLRLMIAFPASLSARSFPFTPLCPGLYIYRFRWWMSNINTIWASHFIFFTSCTKAIESVMMMACIVTVTSWDSPAEGMCNFFKIYLLNTGRLWNAMDWDWIETDRSKFVVVFFVTVHSPVEPQKQKSPALLAYLCLYCNQM